MSESSGIESSAIELIAAERRRQIEREGWTPEHDDDHSYGELADAAACYAASRPVYYRDDLSGGVQFLDLWPWAENDDKRPRDESGEVLSDSRHAMPGRIRELVKAGALIAAEIERLQRAQR